ncbi:hypothetical protein ACFLYU_04710 [Candidatus Dependentiae bacterium]
MKVYKKLLIIMLFVMSIFVTPSMYSKSDNALQKKVMMALRKSMFKIFGVNSLEGYKRLVVFKVNAFIARKRYINLEIVSDGITIIFLPVSSNDVKLVEKLINLGANVNHKTKNSNTPLLTLIAYSALFEFDPAPLAEILMKNGANPTIENNNGENAIEIANKLGLGGMLAVFKKYGYQ